MARERRLTLEEIRRLPKRSQEARDRALEALALMRERGLSATAAAKRTGTTLETVKKYAGRGLEKEASGAWEPTPWDRIIRPMKVAKPKGVTSLPIRDSRTASKIGRYWQAVLTYLETGREDVLEPFEGFTFQVDGETHDLVTDRRTLKRLDGAGEISFEHIYGLA